MLQSFGKFFPNYVASVNAVYFQNGISYLSPIDNHAMFNHKLSIVNETGLSLSSVTFTYRISFYFIKWKCFTL